MERRRNSEAKRKRKRVEETDTWEVIKVVERLSKIRVMRGLLILPIRKLSVTLVGAVLLE